MHGDQSPDIKCWEVMGIFPTTFSPAHSRATNLYFIVDEYMFPCLQRFEHIQKFLNTSSKYVLLLDIFYRKVNPSSLQESPV